MICFTYVEEDLEVLPKIVIEFLQSTWNWNAFQFDPCCPLSLGK